MPVGAGTRLKGSGAQCLAIGTDEVYVGCRGSGLQRIADGGDTDPGSTSTSPPFCSRGDPGKLVMKLEAWG